LLIKLFLADNGDKAAKGKSAMILEQVMGKLESLGDERKAVRC